MRNFGIGNLKGLGIMLCFSVSFFLAGCGNSGVGNNNFHINAYGFELEYSGESELERVNLKTDDFDEIVDLYQEIGDNSEYKDSLLIAEKFAQGLGANAFTQDNLDTLEDQGLTLSNIKKTQIGLEKYGKNINAVLVEYEITQGLTNDVPLLYVSQLFVPNNNSIILMSFISESKSSSVIASNMFKNIK